MARLKPLNKLMRLLRGRRPTASQADGAAKPRRASNQHPHFKQLIDAYGIVSVIDVGANAGQFAQHLRGELGYGGRIASVEPLPDAFAALAGFSAADENWSALNLALGDAEGVLPINIAGNSGSSSFLPMLLRHEIAAPKSRYKGQAEVRVARLDAVPELRAATNVSCMLKIDTQGYELSVLRGADSILDRFSLVYLEVSFVPLYEGGPLIEDVIGYLRQGKFDPIAIYQGFGDGRAGHQLQADILFANADRMAAVLGTVDRT